MASLNSMRHALSSYNIPLIGIRCIAENNPLVRLQCLQSLFPSNKESSNKLFAMFTDDICNPLQFFVCRELAKSIHVPMLAFESNKVLSRKWFQDESFQAFESSFQLGIEELSSMDWESHFDVTIESVQMIQKRLHFNNIDHQFIPSVLCNGSLTPAMIVEWDKIGNEAQSYGVELLARRLSADELANSTHDNNMLIGSSKLGILSPLQWCKAYAKNPSRFCELSRYWMNEEYFTYKLLQSMHNLIVINPSSGNICTLDWFAAMNAETEKILLDPNGVVTVFQRNMHDIYGTITPKDLRCCATPIKKC